MANSFQKVSTEEELFEWKDYYLNNNDYCELKHIDVSYFFTLLFGRDCGKLEEFTPFEDVMSEEWKKWREWKEWSDHQDTTVSDAEKFARKKIVYSTYRFWRYNPIIMYKENGKISHRIMLNEDADTLHFLENRQFAITSPITYVGRNRLAKNARYLYAFAVDLDGVGQQQMVDVLFQSYKRKYIPPINIFVNSGHGLHLYFLLKKPIPLFPDNVKLLQKLKKGLTTILWNEYLTKCQDVQYQGIFQGFRIPGTLTKFGKIITAWWNDSEPSHSIAEINDFLGVSSQLTADEVAQLDEHPYNPLGVTLEEAKRRWPEWYDNVIVQKKPRKPSNFVIKRALYDWWLRRLRSNKEKIIVGHRFFCVFALAVYASKCNIPQDELYRDAHSLLGKLEKLTTEDDNHFTAQDIDDALTGNKQEYRKFTKDAVERLTALRMPQRRVNGQKQVDHLEEARMLRDLRRKRKNLGPWDQNKGRKKETLKNSKVAQKVIKWMIEHPDNTNKSEAARDLGLSRPTITKWWRYGL